MTDPVAVDHRVPRDRRRDHDPEDEPAEIASRAADKQDADRHHQHSEDAECRWPRAARGDHDQQREHRRQPARDGIDQAQLIAPIRGREQRNVRELERGRPDDERDGVRVDAPGECRRQHQPRDERKQRDRGGRLGITLAGEEQIPEGVQPGGAERQRQRVERHARDRTIVGCT